MRRDNDHLIIRRPEPSADYYRIPANLWKTEHRFLGFLGKFGFKSDEAVAYNYYAAYYLGGKLNHITEWQHDLDESYLERWQEKDRRPKWRRI
jgi:hypothetical protein